MTAPETKKYKKMPYERLVRLAKNGVKNGRALSEVGPVLEEIERRKQQFSHVTDSQDFLEAQND
jgi:septation ring formation regulator EzrA